MEKYLSANNIKIPVLSEDSKEFVRYLEDKDVDEEFIHELKHDNIKVVYIDKSLKKLAYQTRRCCMIPCCSIGTSRSNRAIWESLM